MKNIRIFFGVHAVKCLACNSIHMSVSCMWLCRSKLKCTCHVCVCRCILSPTSCQRIPKDILRERNTASSMAWASVLRKAYCNCFIRCCCIIRDHILCIPIISLIFLIFSLQLHFHFLVHLWFGPRSRSFTFTTNSETIHLEENALCIECSPELMAFKLSQFH